MHTRGSSPYLRKVVTVSAAAIAAVALSTPLAHAQDDGAGGGAAADASGSLDAGSLQLGSLAGGSLDSAGDGEGGPEVGSAQAGSLSGAAPSEGVEETCDLPGLGGSVAKFYPLFGLGDVPSGIMDVITSTLDSFPNVLEMVAGEGAGAAVLGQTGSLAEPLCTTILGGEMTQAPTVDEDDASGTGQQDDDSADAEQQDDGGSGPEQQDDDSADGEQQDEQQGEAAAGVEEASGDGVADN